jgi:hypothetical protein
MYIAQQFPGSCLGIHTHTHTHTHKHTLNMTLAYSARFQVLTAVTANIFSDMMSCGSEDVSRRFGRTNCLHPQGRKMLSQRM